MFQKSAWVARVLLAGLFATGLSVSAFGQDLSTAPRGTADPQVVAGRVLQLSVDEAVRLALEQNLTLQVERINPRVQDLAVSQARAAWVPTVGTAFQNSNQNSPSGSVFEGAAAKLKTDAFSSRVSAEQQLPWGGRYSVFWDSSRTESTQSFITVNPRVSSSLNLSFSQPLLRNFGIDAARQQLLVTRKDRDMSDVDLQRTVLNTIRSVKNGYWDLSYAVSSLNVQRQSLELAQESLRNNKARVQIGTMAPIDIIEAEAEVAQREEAVILAEAALEQAQDRLRALIFDPATPEFWQIRLDLSDMPAFEARPIDIDVAMSTALERRTDLRHARMSLERNDIAIRYHRNQTLPEINLRADYRVVGQGGTELEYDRSGFPPQVIGSYSIGYSSVLRQLFKNDFPTWSVSLSVGYPIGTSAAQANLARARLQHSQAELRIRNLELQAATQIRDVARQVNTNVKRVEATRASRQLAEKRLEAEQKKFTAGMSTSFFVLQAQRDLAQARNAEVRAILDYNRSLVDFESVQEAPIGGGGGIVVGGSSSSDE
jgi:outer membrane protein